MKNSKRIIIILTVLLFCGQVIGNYSQFELAAVPNNIYQTFQLNDMQFSSLLTAPMLPALFFSIVMGLLVDKFGISGIISVALCIATAGLVLRCFASSYSVMLIAMAMSGFGCFTINSNISKIVSAFYPMDKVSRVVGILMAGANISQALAFATTAFYPNLLMAFLVPALFSVITAVLWIVYASNNNIVSGMQNKSNNNHIMESLRICLRSPNLWITGLTLMLIMGAVMVISNFHVVSLITLRGYNENLAGSFSTIMMMSAILGSVFFPSIIINNKHNAPYIVLVLLITSSATCYGMIALHNVGIYICVILNGIFRSGIIATLMMIPVMLPEIGRDHAGTAGGFILTLQMIGCIVIPTYVVIPLGNGSFITYFIIASICMLMSAFTCFVLMRNIKRITV